MASKFLCFVQIILKHHQENTRIQPATIEVVANPWQIETSSPNGVLMVAMDCAGFPCPVVSGQTHLVTTLPASTIAPHPIVTGGSTIIL
jgi:hypothetical protein